MRFSYLNKMNHDFYFSQMISATRVTRSTLALTFFTTKVAIQKEKQTQKKLKLAIRKESCHA